MQTFCPSCQQKRALLFAEWLDTHILEQVSHAQYIFAIPKLLRPIFKYHRLELGLLCKSAWQALREMFREVASDPSTLPGVVITVQSYGDRLNFHPHIHAIASRRVWSADGSFEPIHALDALQLMSDALKESGNTPTWMERRWLHRTSPVLPHSSCRQSPKLR
jgi:hypothetical protein